MSKRSSREDGKGGEEFVVDVNNGLVGIVWALTGKKRKELGSGRKRQWRRQIGKEGRKNRS